MCIQKKMQMCGLFSDMIKDFKIAPLNQCWAPCGYIHCTLMMKLALYLPNRNEDMCYSKTQVQMFT